MKSLHVVIGAVAATTLLICGCSFARQSVAPGTPGMPFTNSNRPQPGPFLHLSNNHVVAFYVLSDGSYPAWSTIGSDNNVWFTESGIGISQIGRITPAGSITQFPTPSVAYDITRGRGNWLWYLSQLLNQSPVRIGKISTSGNIKEFSLPNGSSFPQKIALGSDGNMWFTDSGTNSIGTITPQGVITEFQIPTASSGPLGIESGPDGNTWFTESTANKVGRITPSGTITEYVVPKSGNQDPRPYGIVAGPDGNLWVADSSQPTITKVTTSGVVTNFADGGCYGTVSVGTAKELLLSNSGCGQAATVGAFNITNQKFQNAISGPIFFPSANFTVGADGDMWFSDYRVQGIGVYEEDVTTIGIRLNGEMSYTDPNYGFELGYAAGTGIQTQTVSLSSGESVKFKNLDTIPHSAAFLGNATANSAPWPTTFTGSTTQSVAGTMIGTTGWATGSLKPNRISPIYETGSPGFYMIGDQYDYVKKSMRTVIIVH